MSDKSCGNCIHCFKGNDFWSCEDSYEACGMPVKCSPPYDEACRNWSDNPDDMGKPSEELRNFVDHFWGEEDDWDD